MKDFYDFEGFRFLGRRPDSPSVWSPGRLDEVEEVPASARRAARVSHDTPHTLETSQTPNLMTWIVQK